MPDSDVSGPEPEAVPAGPGPRAGTDLGEQTPIQATRVTLVT